MSRARSASGNAPDARLGFVPRSCLEISPLSCNIIVEWGPGLSGRSPCFGELDKCGAGIERRIVPIRSARGIGNNRLDFAKRPGLVLPPHQENNESCVPPAPRRNAAVESSLVLIANARLCAGLPQTSAQLAPQNALAAEPFAPLRVIQFFAVHRAQQPVM